MVASGFYHPACEYPKRASLEELNDFIVASAPTIWKGEDNFAMVDYEDGEFGYRLMFLALIDDQFLIIARGDAEFIAVTPTQSSRPMIIDFAGDSRLWSAQWLVDRPTGLRAVRAFLVDGSLAEGIDWVEAGDEVMGYLLGEAEQVLEDCRARFAL